MISLRPFIAAAALAFSFFMSTAKDVSFASFGAVPDDGVNDMAALKKAVEYCRSHPGTTLVMEPGVYDIEDRKSVV